MKITTNFVQSPVRLARPLAIGLWGLVGVVAVTGLSLWHATIDTRNEIPDLRERLTQLDQRRHELAAQPVLPVAELRQLKQRVAALNVLSSNRGHSVGSLLADLEQWLPDQAWLVSLHDRAKEGEVLVSPMTVPDVMPAMRKAAAIVTDEGGITCHAAIVARELKKPCVVGTKTATTVFKTGDRLIVDTRRCLVRKK